MVWGRAPLRYAELARTYGPVFAFRRGAQVVCIVNSYKVRVLLSGWWRMCERGADGK